ncbi:hypothetical protein AB4300_25980, partial [Vibrio lentus]
MFIKSLLFLLLLFSFNSYSEPICIIETANAQYRNNGYAFGDVVDIGIAKLPGHSVKYGACMLTYRGKNVLGGKYRTCPSDKIINLQTGKCESSCKQMEGQSLGTVTFPEGTRDVASLCRNSCRAKSDLFFPAATPPYGVFTYTGESCDGSESSGGETGG